MIVRGSAVPLYEQVKRHLLREIASGDLAVGRQLPSERRLVADFGVSRITVRKALGDLVQDGVLYSVPAKGFFVGSPGQPHELHALRSFSEDARARGQVPGSRLLEATLVPADAALAAQLGVPPGAELASIRRLRLLDGMPVVVQHVWLPLARCPSILDIDFERESLFAVLAGRYGVTLARGETIIGARLADREERRLLRLSDRSAVLTVDQVTYTRDGTAVELLRSAQNPRRYPLSISHDERPGGRGGMTIHQR